MSQYLAIEEENATWSYIHILSSGSGGRAAVQVSCKVGEPCTQRRRRSWLPLSVSIIKHCSGKRCAKIAYLEPFSRALAA